MQAALEQVRNGAVRFSTVAKKLGGKKYPGGCYVCPCIVSTRHDMKIVHDETFAPILNIIRYRKFVRRHRLSQRSPAGLSSAIFTNDIREAELFLSARGGDCGIANVEHRHQRRGNRRRVRRRQRKPAVDAKAAAIPGKAYMRRQTATIKLRRRTSPGAGHQVRRIRTLHG